MKNGVYKEYYYGDLCNVYYKDNEIYCTEYDSGYKEWIKIKDNDSVLHRLDGPAIEWPQGDKAWYIEGKWIRVYSQEEFEDYLRLEELRAFE